MFKRVRHPSALPNSSPPAENAHDSRMQLGLCRLAKSYADALSALTQHLQERKSQAAEAEDYEEE